MPKQELMCTLFIIFVLFLWGVSPIVYKTICPKAKHEQQLVATTNRAEDLATYYEQHKTATPAVKETIGELVAIKFISFDKEQLVNGALKQFLVNQRVRFKEVK